MELVKRLHHCHLGLKGQQQQRECGCWRHPNRSQAARRQSPEPRPQAVLLQTQTCIAGRYEVVKHALGHQHKKSMTYCVLQLL